MVSKIVNESDDIGLFVNSVTGSYSLRALKPFPVNTVILKFGIQEFIPEPAYYSLQVDDNKHITLSPNFLRYTNHSCEPNTFFDTSRWEVIAIKHINQNDEITFFYPSTEWDMSQPFNCNCQTGSCLGSIKGARYLDQSVLVKYCFNDHILKKLSALYHNPVIFPNPQFVDSKIKIL